jgi:hypothetical protein
MYTCAYKKSEQVVLYFDAYDNAYAAIGGSLSWRLNNPGLVPSRSPYARLNGSIGSCDGYAVFPDPLRGRRALLTWIRPNQYYSYTLIVLAKYYCPSAHEEFAATLASKANITVMDQLNKLNHTQFEHLLNAIDKLCGYTSEGEGVFLRLPKIIGKIERNENTDSYLLENNTIVSIEEAINRVQASQLDAVIVHGQDGKIHLRSRPHHRFIIMHLPLKNLSVYETPKVIARVVGAKNGKYIWAFINGINNTKEEAIASAEMISKYTNDEKVFAMQNDTLGLSGIIDFFICIVLKATWDCPVVRQVTTFLKYLLSMSKESQQPVVVFAHSQGAIIVEHALHLLNKDERAHLRIFTFGGGSMIAPEQCHPDSHNYANAQDFICFLGSPNWQMCALERYYGRKWGKTDEEIIKELAMRDALLHSDSISMSALEAYEKGRIGKYEKAFADIRNLTVLDPCHDSKSSHTFKNDCYQNEIQAIIKRYQEGIQ